MVSRLVLSWHAWVSVNDSDGCRTCCVGVLVVHSDDGLAGSVVRHVGSSLYQTNSDCLGVVDAYFWKTDLYAYFML